MTNVVLVALFVISSGGPTPLTSSNRISRPCFNSSTQRDENIPFNTADDGHSDAHAAAIFDGSTLLGWIYQDKDLSRWFVGNSNPTLSRSKIENAAHLMGLSKSDYTNANPKGFDLLRGFGIAITRPISLVDVTNVPLTIIRCW